MKRIVFLIGLILVTSTTFAYGGQIGNPQNLDVKSDKVRADKIKAFVGGFETYAKKIIDDYKKEVEEIEAKYKAEKYHEMMNKAGEYFHDKDFNLREWILIQQEFDKRYELGGAGSDQLGSVGACGMVRQYLEKNLPQSLSTTVLEIISNKEYCDTIKTTYIYYVSGKIIDYFNKGEDIDNEVKSKISDTIAKLIYDKTTSTELRIAAADILAGDLGANESAVKAILDILSDPKEDEEVKSRAMYTISMRGVGSDFRIREKITDIITNRDKFSNEIVNNAISSAVVLQDREVAKILLDILQSTKNEQQFKEARYFLQGYHDKEIMKSILKNHNRFGEEKFSFLGEEDVLIEIINEGSDDYLGLAIKALGENTPQDSNNPTKVVRALERQLYHPDPKIRITSIDAIQKISMRGDKEKSKEKNKEILAILNKAKAEEKNKEAIDKIEKGIKTLQNEP